jgi:hypothetical protein
MENHFMNKYSLSIDGFLMRNGRYLMCPFSRNNCGELCALFEKLEVGVTLHCKNVYYPLNSIENNNDNNYINEYEK